MTPTTTSNPRTRHLLRLLAFLLPVILIVYFLPRKDRNAYTYEEGRPWTYALLTAPFDIPIHLDSTSISHIKDSIDAQFQPIYTRDLTLEKTIISDYTTRLSAIHTLTPTQKNQIIAALRQVYDAGIVTRDTYARIQAGELPAVRYIHDNIAISIPTADYLSAVRAYQHIDSLLRTANLRTPLSATHLDEILQPNITLDTIATNRLLNEAYQTATAPIGVIQQGERIIDKGDIITPRLATILHTYEQLLDERGQANLTLRSYTIAGQTLYILLLITILYAYLLLFRPDYLRQPRTTLFLLTLITLFILFAFAMHATFRLGYYITPFTIVPILILVFLDSRTALLAHTLTTLACALIATYPLEFIFIQYLAGFVAIASLTDLTRRSQLIRTALLIFLAYALGHIALETLQTGTLNLRETRIFGALGINAILISFSYVLMFIIERTFGFTSRVTLVELSDTNNPLLRELSEQCPGTFNHSMSVSNLAAAAAQRIGANVQMIRTGALYHDIGKIKNPAFYTENQHGVNPHDALDPIQSARIITGHVHEGLLMAEKAKLPAAIRQFIAQHHGAGTARYFYNTYCNAHPDLAPIDPAPFSYPGPDPQTRETSLLMMADAVEAASRSMTDHSPQAITTLVDRIIDGQIAEGLHNQSPLSFRDVQAIKETFAQRLRTMYHSRISYPELKKDTPDQTPTPDQPTPSK